MLRALKILNREKFEEVAENLTFCVEMTIFVR